MVTKIYATKYSALLVILMHGNYTRSLHVCVYIYIYK